ASVPMLAWADEIFAQIEAAGRVLDDIRGDDTHARAIAAQRAKLDDPELTSSARGLRAMRENGQSFLEFARAHSAAHAAYFHGRPLDEAATR
ncbi:glutamate--cysteine ligase, partial [Burkholderia pseudomallei]